MKSFKEYTEEDNPRIPRKKGQPANSKKHSDLYTDENPKDTIHGLGFKDVATAEASVKKIENSGRKHAHKIQAAVAMEQRAREMGKTAEAAVYRKYIEKMKKKTKEKNESLWATIHKKRQRIKQGSGERMRKKGEKGAPTPAQMQRAKNASEETIQAWFESTETRGSYQYKYGEDWWWKLNETHDAMLEKIGVCCEDCKEDKQSVTSWKVFKEQNFWGEIEEAAEYQGRKVTLNKPTKGDVKKSKVYVKNDKGNVVKVEFGDPNMEIKRDDPARRKSFRARHNCDNPGPKYKARYWSCKFWSANKSVSDLMKG